MQAVPCLVCGAATRRFFRRSRTRLWRGVGPSAAPRFVAVLRLCAACGHVQQELTVALQQRIQRAYMRAHSISTEAGETGWSALRAELLLRLLGTTRAPRRVLEIGCGNGNVLRLLRQHGTEEAVGIEPGLQRARHTSGVRLLPGYFDGRQVAQRHFDLVYALAVLEHVTDPVRLLRDMTAAVRPNGRVIILVPATEAPLRAGDLGLFIHEHLSYFTRASLCRALQRAGLRVLRMREESKCLLAVATPARRALPEAWRPPVVPACGYAQRVSTVLTRVRQVLRRDPAAGLYGACSALHNALSWLPAGIAARACLLDGDPAKHGRRLAGGTGTVRPPAAACGCKTVVIFPCGFQKAISRDLRRQGYRGRIVRLYHA